MLCLLVLDFLHLWLCAVCEHYRDHVTDFLVGWSTSSRSISAPPLIRLFVNPFLVFRLNMIRETSILMTFRQIAKRLKTVYFRAVVSPNADDNEADFRR